MQINEKINRSLQYTSGLLSWVNRARKWYLKTKESNLCSSPAHMDDASFCDKSLLVISTADERKNVGVHFIQFMISVYGARTDVCSQRVCKT